MILEICASTIQSALAAQAAGAQRIELCENLAEGGTTPSLGTLTICKQYLDIPIYVLIRPRAGDFLYSELEFEVMKADIKACKEIGMQGVVLGILNAEGEIDIPRTRELVELAAPMGVTFHRAFDRCVNPVQALEDIIETGCERILTSGQKASVLQATPLLEALIVQAAGRIIIMPGAGITSGNIRELLTKTSAQEFHSSAKRISPSLMNFQNPLIDNEAIQVYHSDPQEIKDLSAQLSKRP